MVSIINGVFPSFDIFSFISSLVVFLVSGTSTCSTDDTLLLSLSWNVIDKLLSFSSMFISIFIFFSLIDSIYLSRYGLDVFTNISLSFRFILLSR